jgi:hypothetical protein
MAETKTQQILIRFRGICAHLDMPGKKKRTVLVRHRTTDFNIEHHTPHVEFYADDVVSFSPDLNVISYSRPGVDGRLARVDLEDGTIIRIKGATPGVVEEEPSYVRDVPRFSEILKVQPPINQKIAATLLGDISAVDSSRVVAVFDMPAGRLVAGEPEHQLTRFAKIVPFDSRPLARWADLHATVPSDRVVLELESKGGVVRGIQFKERLRMLTIGNEPERLILGVISGSDHAAHGHTESVPPQPSGHFVLYYDLLEVPPEKNQRFVPIPSQLGGTGCPNNNYP